MAKLARSTLEDQSARDTEAEIASTNDTDDRDDSGDDISGVQESLSVKGVERDQWARDTRSRWGPTLLIVLILAAAAFAISQGREWQDQRGAASDRSEAVSVAKKVAVELSTTNFETVDADLDAVLKLATGEFETTVRGNKSAQSALVKQYKVRSATEIDESGVVSQSADTVKVALALTSQIKNSRSDDIQTQLYRMVVQVQKQSDGLWLASNVEFVS